MRDLSRALYPARSTTHRERAFHREALADELPSRLGQVVEPDVEDRRTVGEPSD